MVYSNQKNNKFVFEKVIAQGKLLVRVGHKTIGPWNVQGSQSPMMTWSILPPGKMDFFVVMFQKMRSLVLFKFYSWKRV